MRINLVFISALTVASGSAMASTSISFRDTGFAMSMLNQSISAGSSLITSGLFREGSDEPVVMFANASDPFSVISNTMPMPQAPNGSINNFETGFKGSGSDGGSKELPRVVVVPLPAPAGLALAGVLLIAGIRRR